MVLSLTLIIQTPSTAGEKNAEKKIKAEDIAIEIKLPKKELNVKEKLNYEYSVKYTGKDSSGLVLLIAEQWVENDKGISKSGCVSKEYLHNSSVFALNLTEKKEFNLGIRSHEFYTDGKKRLAIVIYTKSDYEKKWKIKLATEDWGNTPWAGGEYLTEITPLKCASSSDIIIVDNEKKAAQEKAKRDFDNVIKSAAGGGSIADCKDLDCFINAAKTCSPARLTSAQQLDFFGPVISATAQRQIIGKDNTGMCVYYSKTVKMEVKLPPDMEKKMSKQEKAEMEKDLKKQQPEMACKYTVARLTEILNKEKKGSLEMMTEKDCLFLSTYD